MLVSWPVTTHVIAIVSTTKPLRTPMTSYRISYTFTLYLFLGTMECDVKSASDNVP